MATIGSVMAAVAVLIVAMVAYAVGARKNSGPIRLQAVGFLLVGWFATYAFYRFLAPEEAPRYFEANVVIEADGRGVCAVPVALDSRDRVAPGSGGQWEQLKKQFVPQAEGDHLLTVTTGGKAGTVQVLVEY